MAKKKGLDQEDTPQYNYRHPGEPNTIAESSKEQVDDDADKEELKRIKNEEERAEKQREGMQDPDTGLSPNRGMSDPKSQKEIDDENSWSPPR